MNQELAPISRKTKIEHYGWNALDKEGEFQMVYKKDIFVDKRYQRGLNQSRVLEISRNFSWGLFGTLTVVSRNGVFYVAEGQHRLMAAMNRADITHVPCMVFYHNDIKKEANLFLLINTMRKAMYTYEKINALCVTGDPVTAAVNEIIQKTGHYFGKNSSGKYAVSCGRTLMKCYQRDPVLFGPTWDVCVGVCGEGGIHGEIFEGLFYIAKDMGISLALYREKLIAAGRANILSSIATAKSFYSKGGPKVYASGIANIINYRLREANRITV